MKSLKASISKIAYLLGVIYQLDIISITLVFAISYLKNIFTPQVDALKLKGHVHVDQRRFGVELGKKADLSLQHQVDRSSKIFRS